MPLQQYQQAQINAPTQTSTQSGLTGATVARAQQSLASRLKQFESTLFSAAVPMVQADAVEAGTIDIQKRKEKVSAIMSDDSLNEIEKKEAISNITEGQEKSNFGIYGRAYNNAASAAYTNQVTNDAASASNIAMADSNGDPDDFATRMSKYREETINSAPSREAAIVANRAFTKYGAAGYKSLATKQYADQRALNKKSFEDVYESLGKQYIDAYATGKTVQATELKSQLITSVVSAARDGFITPKQADIMLNQVEADGKYAKVKEGIISISEMTKNPAGYMNDQLNTALVDNPDNLTITQLQDLKKDITEAVKNSGSRAKAKKSIQDEHLKNSQEKEYLSNVELALSGGLTLKEIDLKLANNEISLVQAKDLKSRIAEGGQATSNTARIAQYNVPGVLERASYENILNDPKLNATDTLKVLDAKKKYKSEKWTSTTNGTEARDRIKRKFGIVTDAAFVNFDGRIARDFDATYREFYDSVMSYPTEERDAIVLQLADKAIKTYEESQIETKDQVSKRREEKKLEALKRDADNYNKSPFNQFMQSVGLSDKMTVDKLKAMEK